MSSVKLRRMPFGTHPKLWPILAVLVLEHLLLGCRSEGSAGGDGARVVATAPASAVVSARAQAGERLPGRELTWEFGSTAVGPMVVVVSVPAHAPGQKFPVLVAMHGRGEAFKGPARGARGWVDDYALPRAIERLEHPPLVAGDFGGEVDPQRLALLNQSLARTPYAGLIVVCPYTPDILAGERAFSAAVPLATFIVDELLPRVLRETPALSGAAHVGIDGVSLGGRAALLAGFERPKDFGVVASLQAAIDPSEIRPLVVRAMRARTVNRQLGLRLLTSDRDYFVREIETLSSALSEADIEHSFVRVQGDHSYEFNRGAGALEMLLFHDRALRSKPTL